MLVCLHGQRIRLSGEFHTDTPQLAVDEALERNGAGNILRSPRQPCDKPLDFDVLDPSGVLEPPSRFLNQRNAVAAQKDP